MLNTKRLLHAVAVVALGICAIVANAQNTSGTIVGHVTDPNGAAVVGAKVTVTNVATREIRTTTTSQVGDFTIPLLSPGTYQVNVTAPGFKAATLNGIALDVDQTIRSEIALTVGAVSETVSVTTDQVALDADSPSINQVIGSKEIAELPLNGRNFQDLLFISPGAVNNPGGEQSSYRLTISGDSDSSISIGGSRGSSEGYTVDGTTILDINYDTPAFGPSLDDVAEFDALTKSYSAAYGYSMNQINVISKSGTNELHGSGFDYLRNTYADALDHGFTPGSNVALLQRNQFGYSLGGPVYIPFLYNGRNKTFFFANYEGFRQVQGGGAALASVPTADEMTGKFDTNVLGTLTAAEAAVRNAHNSPGCTNPVTYKAGSPRPLFNPYDPNGCPFPVASDGSYTIPSADISALGKLLMRPGLYFPASPNVTNNTPGLNNYAFGSRNLFNFDQQNYRVDQNFGQKDSLFFHMTWHNEDSGGTNPLPVNELVENQPARLYTATETHVFSPSLSNSLRLGFMHAQSVIGPGLGISSADLSALNLPNPVYTAGAGYPRVEFDSNTYNDGITYGGGSSFYSGIRTDRTNVWDLGESLIWSIKRHTLSMGFGGRATRLITNGNGIGLSRFDFDGLYSGDIFADALMGAGSSYGLGETGTLAEPGYLAHFHFTTWAPYFQDDWKVNEKLTLNLGLRYEYAAVPFEEQNFFYWPDFNAPGGAMYYANPKVVAQFNGPNPFAPGSQIFVTPPNGERGPGPAPKDVFAPRLGAAYMLDSKTVIRGGFGKYYDTLEQNELQASSSGIFPQTVGSTTNNGPLPAPGAYAPAYWMSSLPVLTVAGGETSFYTNPNSGLGWFQVQGDHYLTPYFLAWNLGVERQLPWNMKLALDYTGNHGTRQFSRQNPNAASPCQSSYGCTVTAGTPSIPWQSRTPYQNLGFMIVAAFNGFSNYNAGNLKLEQRSRSLDLIVSYTLSKSLDTKSAVAGFGGDDGGWAGPQDGRDIAADYGLSNFDVHQRLAATAVFSLPFGRGQLLLPNAPRALDALVGGWNLGALISAQGGLPFTIQASDQGINNTDSERANFTPGVAFTKSLNGWISPAFTQPAAGYFGNSARDAVRAPGQFLGDLSLAKKFNIWEHLSSEVDFNAFNAFNHWNPGQPGNTNVDNQGPNSGYGVIYQNTSQNAARILQIAGRITF